MSDVLKEFSERQLFEGLTALLNGEPLNGSVVMQAIDADAQRLPTLPNDEGNWQALNSWYRKQRFNPYPNMARHRLAYLLDWRDGRCWLRLHKAYRSRDDSYQPKADFQLSSVVSNTRGQRKLPKFVTLTDQQILHQLEQGLSDGHFESRDDQLFCLQGDQGEALLTQILRTGRCFWQSCKRPPLVVKTVASVRIDKVPEVDHFHLGRFYHDEPFNSIIEWVTQPQRFSTPIESKLTPRLSVESCELPLPWQTANLDIARFRLCQGEQCWTMSELFNAGEQLSDYMAEQIIQFNRQLFLLPLVAASVETPVSEQFDIGDRILPDSFTDVAPVLRQLQLSGWQIEISSRYRLNGRRPDKWYAEIEADSERTNVGSTNVGNTAAAEQRWFDLQLGVELDGQRLNLLPYLVAALQQGKLPRAGEELTVTLENGELLKLPGKRLATIAATLVELFEERALTSSGKLRLAQHQLGRLTALPDTHQTDSDQTGRVAWYGDTWLREKAKELASGAGTTAVPVPQSLQTRLRDYQRQGLDWLQFIARSGLAGILADDMGLGKTVQALAHLLVEQESGRMNGPSLVVAPTSVLSNWAAEASRFAPSLRVLVLSGANRKPQLDSLEQYDLVITSYGTLLRDAELLRWQPFYLLLLDEAQTIKNSRSKMARTVVKIPSRHRLCLTGTPLENHLGELWSLFNFLMPGFLGSKAQFKRLYRQPIENGDDKERRAALAARIGPFILRRTKQQVAQELPPKTEIAELIDLETSQADFYETIRLSTVEQVQRAIRTDGAERNQLLIGNALLRLRQVCCHPALVKFDAASQLNDSAKLTWLRAMLPEMVAEGRRILLFSSFTSMLDIIATELDQLAISFQMLTGKSRNRGQLVKRFQQGEVSVFLISLKAGGTGLNLTAADTVIHFDPWWNPAAEQQASDRVYRIGQDKPVFVYKLIAKGTVEQRIQELQNHKQNLADSLYSDSSSPVSKLGSDECTSRLRLHTSENNLGPSCKVCTFSWSTKEKRPTSRWCLVPVDECGPRLAATSLVALRPRSKESTSSKALLLCTAFHHHGRFLA